MISILLQDHKNKLFQKMLHLSEETELLICQNVNTLNRSGHQLNISTIDPGTPMNELEMRGYRAEEALYDKLILDYNQENSPLLKMWC